ncbi:DJ-1/PfpI family protein [Winogradskyella sp.]|uniref:DJ-1/PfpI family protein n=1 Tax=Winogradskyella sp. TaxID=1883156 RepID=UPI002631825E|nr:DJ-1/PfpI family protein [Winogradskyella sp.]
MKKILFLIVFILPLSNAAQSNKEQKKVLMVVSSYGKDMGETRPGYEFDEFSQAYIIFKNNNLAISIASPKGGKPEPDKFNKEKLYNKILLEDKEALKLLENTIATANIEPDEYDAIYIVGGKGAMFDLPYDASLQDIILNLYKREDTVIASVCHGPAAFANVKDGESFILKDIEITGFCNVEENLFGKKWVNEFPFKLEDQLISRGAVFKQADFMLSNVVVSGQFVTGQNPYSTTKSAEAVVTHLGFTPLKRELYNDEKSVYFIQKILDNRKTTEWAEKELQNNKTSYDIPLIATYGYYKILASKENNEELLKGIKLIELTSPHFFHEKLQILLAQTYIQIDKTEKAKSILKDLIGKNMLKEEAEKLLKDIKTK